MFTEKESEWTIMAYITSDDYKTLIYDEDSIQEIDIYINNIAINKDYVKSINYNDNIFESDNFSLGSTTISQFEVELSNDIYNDFHDFNEMRFEYKLIIGSSEEIIPLGTYIIKERDNSSSDYTKFKLYDYMDKFNFAFDASEIVPCTRYELLKAICNNCNVELFNENIVNGDVIVNTYDNSFTAKTYISFIAERAGGFAKITRNDKLIIKSFNEVDVIALPEDKAGDYKTNTLKTITKVIYKNATQLFENGTDDGKIIHLSEENILSCTQEELDNIFNVLNGLQFQTLELRTWGDPSIDTGDIITLGNIKSFAQMSWSWGNGFYGNYKTIINDSESTMNVSKISSKTKLRLLQSKIDEAAGEISIIAQQSEEATEQVAQMRLETDNILLSVGSMEDVIFNSTIYEITKDNNFLEDKSYFYLDENGNYVYLEPSVDYQIGDEITTDVYEEDIIDGLEQRVSNNEMNISNQATTINIISTNIDTTTGDIQSVKTTTGYTLDKDGLKIEKSSEDYNTKIDNTGTYYKDGDSILGQTTKDGSVFKDMILYGKYYYGVDENLDVANFKKDDAMFVSEKYEDANGEVGFGHFYNGGD